MPISDNGAGSGRCRSRTAASTLQFQPQFSTRPPAPRPPRRHPAKTNRSSGSARRSHARQRTTEKPPCSKASRSRRGGLPFSPTPPRGAPGAGGEVDSYPPEQFTHVVPSREGADSGRLQGAASRLGRTDVGLILSDGDWILQHPTPPLRPKMTKLGGPLRKPIL